MMGTEQRRTLREIDNAKRIRRVVERIQASIEAEHAAIEKLKKRLDDPEARAISERYCALEAEMNLTKEKVDLFGDSSLLLELQRRLQRQINTLFERYNLISRLRENDTQYCAILHEDWGRRGEAKVGKKRPARSYLNLRYWCRLENRSTMVKR
jgi:hypothetical protein